MRACKTPAIIIFPVPHSMLFFMKYRSKRKQRAIILVILLIIAGCKKDHPAAPPPPPPKSSEKTVTSFTFQSVDNGAVLIADINGNIGTDTITLFINQGTDISSLIPTIDHSGVSLSPASKVVQNFTGLVNYTVTAEDGSTKKYFVKVVLVRANQRMYIGSDDGNLYALNTNTGTLVWKYSTGSPIQSSPTVVNNTVYAGSNDKYLYAIDATTGILKWKYFTSSTIWYGSPVVSNGTVFISCANNYPDGYIQAVDTATGLLKWKSWVPSPTSPTITDGKVFVSSIEGRTSAFNELNGDTIWVKTLGITASNPAINNGKLYMEGSPGGNEIRCIDPGNGNIIWRNSRSTGPSGPTVDNETVYLSSSNAEQFVEAFDAITGGFKWKYQPIHGGDYNAVPRPPSCPVVLDGILYAGLHHGPFYAINAETGTLSWQFTAPADGLFSNPTAANGVVYAGSSDKYIYALDAVTGALKWKFLTGAAVYSGPCVVDSEGEVFHAGSSGSKN